ncbi:MAG: Sec-independent protein translocase subunit TatA/TatB [Candidatus Loosdrechtia sp.]|uniref:Sec-independent protein translocase subunit TatA/TatB n=1 Tax=Candidatus Loosdrechtia sp. TaxID=3101272 RepID=UPI003A7427ED|nr:MAG: twin-arginine translocase TatA/TatE family subunit [Candidatus Jettenia sp. AMX2]
MFSLPGGWEWVIIGSIVFLFFGKRLPDVMRSVGKSFASFRQGFKGVEEEIKEVKEIKNGIDTITKLKIQQ